MISIAYSIENFAYIFKSFDSSVCYFEDFDEESKSQESENEKKDDKFKNFDDHLFKNWQVITTARPTNLGICRHDFSPLDGYSDVIYSPPDFI